MNQIQTTFVGGVSPFGPRIEEVDPPKRVVKQMSSKQSRAFSLAFIQANPGCTTRELQKAINRTESMVQKYVHGLIKEGSIRKVATISPSTGIVIRYNYFAVQ
jgi:predicted transcriptional regulator